MQRRPCPLAPSIAAGLLLGTSALALGATPPGMGLSVEGAPAPALIRAIEQPVVEDRRFAAGPTEHFELLFNDGTSLTLAPGTALTVERYSWDGETGELAIRLEAGLLRVAGGRLNRTSPITLTSGSCSLDVEDASAVIATGPTGDVRAYMLVGGRVTLASGGSSESLVRPMYQTRAACSGDAPATALRVEQSQVQADAFALNPSLAVLAGLEVEPAAGEEEAVAVIELAEVDEPETTPPSPPSPPPPRPGGSAGPGSVGLGVGNVTAADNINTQPDTITDEGWVVHAQDIRLEENEEPTGFSKVPVQRQRGPTTAKVFGVTNFAQRIDEFQPNIFEVPLVYRLSSKRGFIIGPMIDFLPFINTDESALQYVNIYCFDCDVNRVSAGILIQELGVDTDEDLPKNKLFNETFTQFFWTGFSEAKLVDRSGFEDDTEYLAYERLSDNFVVADVRPARVNAVDPDRFERFIFAAGDVDENLTAKFAVERFFISAGLEDDAKGRLKKVLEKRWDDETGTIVGDIRAFLRNETTFGPSDGLGIPLADSGVLLINRSDASGNDRREVIAQVLHADFGLADDGERSTISLTLGELERFPVEGEPGSRDAELNAQTLASTRGDGKASVFITSPLRSTAAGGGNPNLQGDGKVGYLVVENYVPEQEKPLLGGIERPLGAADPLRARSDAATTDQEKPDFAGRYAVLRLLTGMETELPGEEKVPPVGRSTIAFTGHAAGLLESDATDPVSVFFADGWDGRTLQPNLSLSSDPSTNTLAGLLTLSGADERPIELGRGAGGSAFVDDERFAAMSAIDGDGGGFGLVTASLLGDQPTYQHVQWGFFFGDRIVEQASEAERREHVHLGSWVAGQIDPNEKWKGVATYKGHVVGNVLSGGQLATRVGEFTNSWDFNARRGDIEIKDFDGRDYTGQTRYRNNGPGFTGNLSGGDRQGSLSGNFYRDTKNAAETRPGAVGGQFNLSGSEYRAAGTFAGDRQD